MVYKLWNSYEDLKATDLNNSLDANGWTAYTPTISNLSVGNGSYIARYAQIGKTIIIEFVVYCGSTTTMTGTPTVTVPSGKNIGNATWSLGYGAIYNASTVYPTMVTASGASAMALYLLNTSSTYATWAGPGGVFTIASGNHIGFRAFYETV